MNYEPHSFRSHPVLPFSSKVLETIRRFSPLEQLVFWVLVLMLVGSTLALVSKINSFLLIEVPRTGGSLTEGVVGTPRFINPLLAVSDADRDLSALVYSGLVRPSEDGVLTPDLAESYEISEDGLTYTFILKEDLEFHDGESVTSDDVVFTAHLAQDPTLKSPRRASFEGVAVEKVDERTVRFTLSQPYSPFLENMTIGILPEHIWKDVSSEQFPFSQFNVEPIGTGPYKISDIERNDSGLPEFYELKSFSNFALGKPHISKLTLRFYANEDALIGAYQEGAVEATNGISPERAEGLGAARVLTVPLPRIFGIFFNQNQAPLFTDIVARRALDIALDKNRVVEEVLKGYGEPIYNPIPPGVYTQESPAYASLTASERIAEATSVLERNGWEKNEDGIWQIEEDDEVRTLRFSLATSNTPELKAAAEIAKESWEELGAAVDVQFYDTADLNLNVIRPRRYDALLFGEIIGRELDLFAFWHSSQRNDPGLNIALYTNITTDKLLEDARSEKSRESRLETYRAFEEEVRADVPAVFVYTPDFIYAVPKKLQGLALGTVTTSADRFMNVHEWYIETDHVWSAFQNL